MPPALADNERLCIEYEFIQCFANVSYLHFLAQMKYFNDDSFMRFLKYLRYWKQPEYCQYLVFPQCLTYLDAVIDNEEFRERLSMPQFRDYLHHQQGLHWLHGGLISPENTTAASLETSAGTNSLSSA